MRDPNRSSMFLLIPTGWPAACLAALAAMVLWASGAGPAGVAPADKPSEQVTLQLKWLHQFQFAGYYAARAKGF